MCLLTAHEQHTFGIACAPLTKEAKLEQSFTHFDLTRSGTANCAFLPRGHELPSAQTQYTPTGHTGAPQTP